MGIWETESVIRVAKFEAEGAQNDFEHSKMQFWSIKLRCHGLSSVQHTTLIVGNRTTVESRQASTSFI